MTSAAQSRWLRVVAWVVAGMVVLGVAAAAIEQLSDDSGSKTSRRVALAGFGEIAYRVERSGKLIKKGCVLLAETPAQHQRGLMEVRDLGGYDGMLFRFASDTTGSFYMKNTPMALSIGWFDAAGRFVSSADMEPCLDRPVCPTYSATAPYRYALEVPQGELAGSGIGTGATLSVGGGC